MEETGMVLSGGMSPALAPLDDMTDDVTRGALGSRMPILKIAYAESKGKPEECIPGQLFNTFTGSFAHHFDVVFLGIHTRQSWMPPYSGSDVMQQAYCKSNDGISPSSGTDMQDGPCRKKRRGVRGWFTACPKLEWGKHPQTGKNLPPECNTLLTCVLYELGEQIPVLFTAKKYAGKVLGQFCDRLQLAAMKAYKAEAPKVPGTAYLKVRVSAQPYKTYFIPKFEILPERLTDEEAATVASYADELRTMAKAMDTDEVADITSDADEVPF